MCQQVRIEAHNLTVVAPFIFSCNWLENTKVVETTAWRMYVCIYVCMYICMYVYMYICMYVYMYVGMYVRMYVCM
jgi:hypothetical protein